MFARPLCSFRCSSQFRPVDPLVVAMGSQELQEFHRVIFVSAMALASSGMTENSKTIRLFAPLWGWLFKSWRTSHRPWDNSWTARTIARAICRGLWKLPCSLCKELDEIWEAADAAHAHLPTETESVPLLNAPPLQAEADESAFRDEQDHEDPAGSD